MQHLVRLRFQGQVYNPGTRAYTVWPRVNVVPPGKRYGRSVLFGTPVGIGLGLALLSLALGSHQWEAWGTAVRVTKGARSRVLVV